MSEVHIIHVEYHRNCHEDGPIAWAQRELPDNADCDLIKKLLTETVTAALYSLMNWIYSQGKFTGDYDLNDFDMRLYSYTRDGLATPMTLPPPRPEL